ncbi:hypothetical protein [Clostridium perfringens]|uniref:hypothetical protein n=1 Tax=Clostridium perfringens TaxID=1502 RepID=UPI0039ED76AF
MICYKCNRNAYLRAFSDTKCELCGSPITTSRTPGFKICKSCSDFYNRCSQCGEKMQDIEVDFNRFKRRLKLEYIKEINIEDKTYLLKRLDNCVEIYLGNVRRAISHNRFEDIKSYAEFVRVVLSLFKI